MLFSPLLIVIIVIVAVILVDAARHKVLFQIGMRNLKRRKANTVIVILGLMIGTAIISSSLGVGDTMDELIESDILEDMDKTDVTVYNYTISRDYRPINKELYLEFRNDVLELDKVDGITGEVHGSVPINNPSSRLSEPTVKLMGINYTESSSFGSLLIDGDKVDFSLGEGEIYITKSLSDNLEAEKGDSIEIYSSAFIPTSGKEFKEYTIKDVLDEEGRAAWGSDSKVIVDNKEAQKILGIGNKINFIKISAKGGVEEGLENSDEVSEQISRMIDSKNEYQIFEVQSVKKDDLETFKAQVSTLSDVFLILGSFAIIAGVILTINIFVMLGEERKSESGMSRAIGMKRKHLIRVFLYEGLFYSLSAALAGVISGFGIAFIVFYFMGNIFGITGGPTSILPYFTFTSESFYFAFTAGFLITIITILFTIFRISKLNIIRAIREIPEPPISKKSRRTLYLAIIGIILGSLMTFAGLNSTQLWLPTTGVSLLIIGLGTIGRRWVGDRLAYTIVGIFLLFWWLAPLPFFEAHVADIEMFIISGLFLVTAAVMLIVINGSILTSAMETGFGSGKGFKAVIMSAISHPLKEKFRTAMTLFIFALIIFAITVMGMIVSIFNSNINKMIEEESGGYDILAFTTAGSSIENIQEQIELSDNLDREDFGKIDSGVRGFAPTQNYRGTYQIIGVDRQFVKNNSFGFVEYLDKYNTEEEVWEAVMNDSSLVITQSTGLQFGMPAGEGIGLNSTTVVIDANGQRQEKRVVGLLNQSILQGLFMSEEGARDEFNITSTNVFFLEVNEGSNADDIAKDMKKEFYSYGFQPLVLGTMIKQALSAQYMFFDLFSGFMSLGLIVGIAGLGIISLRAVHERRLEIGMMRAIGFKRKMISYAFLIENSFITIVGIVIGTLLGIGVGWQLYNDGFAPMGWDLFIPWSRFLMIGIIAYGTMLITAIPSAQRASKVSPAEALRFD